MNRREFLLAPGSALLVPSARARTPRTLARAIRGRVLTPGSPGYLAAAHVYNQRFDHVRPGAVALVRDARDVQAAVRWAVAHDRSLRARSGGHSYAGAQLIDVTRALAAHGAALPSGFCPSVGIAGVTLGGGMGLAARAMGLTCDNLIGA